MFKTFTVVILTGRIDKLPTDVVLDGLLRRFVPVPSQQRRQERRRVEHQRRKGVELPEEMLKNTLAYYKH